MSVELCIYFIQKLYTDEGNTENNADFPKGHNGMDGNNGYDDHRFCCLIQMFAQHVLCILYC